MLFSPVLFERSLQVDTFFPPSPLMYQHALALEVFLTCDNLNSPLIIKLSKL